MFLYVVLLLIPFTHSAVIRSRVDMIDNVSCPDSKPIAGVPFPTGKLACYMIDEIIPRTKLYEINSWRWIRLVFRDYRMYRMVRGGWEEGSFYVRRRGRYVEVGPETGSLRLINGLSHSILLKTYGVERETTEVPYTSIASTRVPTTSGRAVTGTVSEISTHPTKSSQPTSEHPVTLLLTTTTTESPVTSSLSTGVVKTSTTRSASLTSTSFSLGTVKPPENSLFSWYIFELIAAVLVIVFVVAVVVFVRIKRQSEQQNIGNTISTITQHIYSNIGEEIDEEIEIFVRSNRHSEQQNTENIISMITQHVYNNTGAELDEETYV